MSPALAGGFLTTVPPEKSPKIFGKLLPIITSSLDNTDMTKSPTHSIMFCQQIYFFCTYFLSIAVEL